jgi:hypothetical protein
MGGPSQQTINTQGQITGEQLQIAEQQNQLQQANYGRMLQMEQPAIDLYSGLVGTGPGGVGGSPSQNTSLQTAMPFISQISQGYNNATQQIYNNLPPGAARDLAISQASQQKDVATANFMTNSVLQAYDKLANMGAGFGSLSLQELGGSLSGYSGASGANQQLGSMQAAASPWNMISQFAGDAMSMFSFGLPGGHGGGGGCWIAEAIYGINDWRTHLVRAWLNGPFMDSAIGRIIMNLYFRFGQRIAAFVRKYKPVKLIFKPIFNIALQKAIKAL